MAAAAAKATGAGPFSGFERMVAWRYLRSRRKEAFISVIAAFSFTGIMLGVATLIIVMAVMNGFRTELLTRILGVNGHVVIQPLDSPLNDYDPLTARLNAVEGVRFALLPIVEGQTLASGNVGAGTGTLVRGVRGADLEKLDLVAKNIRHGTLDDFDSGEGVAIGTRMADNLGLLLGDRITLVSPDGDVTPLGVTPRVKSYPVTAIFEVGMSEFDAGIIFMPLAEAQLYFNSEDRVSSIEVYVDDPDAVDELRPLLEFAAQRQVLITDWRERNRTFFDALNVERNVMFMILTLIVLVAALNIISGLIMLVKDKGSDIAILRTMGATSGSIMRIFLMTGSAIGTAGTLAGVVLGIVVCLNVERIQEFFSWLSGTTLFNPELYFLSQLPAEMDPWETGMVIAMALVLSFLATLFPAWRAAKLDPVDALVRVMPGTFPALELKGVGRRFVQGANKLTILADADFVLKRGEIVALVAPSGAGKSTLLHTAGLLERPDTGDVIVNGTSCGRLGDDARTAMRRNQIGFVYQFHHLLPEFTALENVMMPQLVAGLARKDAETRAMQLLDYMRIGKRAEHRPAELSGGEQQRVAIARAVANAPLILLADEPTGNLDPETSSYVFDALEALVRQSGLAALIATHNHTLANRMDRKVTLAKGKVVAAR